MEGDQKEFRFYWVNHQSPMSTTSPCCVIERSSIIEGSNNYLVNILIAGLDSIGQYWVGWVGKSGLLVEFVG